MYHEHTIVYTSLHDINLFCLQSNERKKRKKAWEVWLPRFWNSHLTPIGWDASQGQRSLSHAALSISIITSVSSQQTPIWLPWKGFSILLNENTKLCSFCSECGLKIRMVYLCCALLFSKMFQHRCQQWSRASGMVWSLLTLEEIKKAHRKALALFELLNMSDSVAKKKKKHVCRLQTPHIQQQHEAALDVCGWRAASAPSFLRPISFIFYFWGSGECAFPGIIVNRAPPWEAAEWPSQQLPWQLFSKVHLIYLI